MKLRNVFAMLILTVFAGAPESAPAAATDRPSEALLQAARAVASARAVFEEARRPLFVIRHNAATAFESLPEWKAARAALEQARRETAATRTAAMRKRPEYADLVVRHYEAQVFMDSISSPLDLDGNPHALATNDDDLRKAAKEQGITNIEIIRIRAEVKKNDPAYIAAKKKYDDAWIKWDTLQTRLDEVVARDPGYPAIRRQIEIAEAAYKNAQAKYNDAVRAARLIEIAVPEKPNER